MINLENKTKEQLNSYKIAIENYIEGFDNAIDLMIGFLKVNQEKSNPLYKIQLNEIEIAISQMENKQ